MPIFNFILKNKLILLVFLTLNLFFQFIPAINYIGYEFSVLNSLIIYWIIGLIFYKQNRVDKSEQFYSIIIVLIPLFVSLSDIFYVDIEIFLDGLYYYLLIVLASYFFSLTVAVSASSLKSKFRRYLVHFIVFILIIMSNVFEIYFFPQIYIYNILIGYFPGTVYDELILITPKFVIYRLCVITFSISLIIILNKLKWQKYYFTLSLFALLLIYFFLKPTLGLSSTIKETTERLNQQIVTKHFIIHFAPSIQKDEKYRVANLHEYYYERISNLLNRQLSKKIESFIYADSEQKSNLFGSMAADVSKPWLYQIYLDYGSVDNNLQHELVHTFTGEFGVTPLKLAKDFNAALIEGFASAVDDSLSGNNIHYYANLALSYNKNYELDMLFNNTSFFNNYSSFSYVIAGSFIKYLISEYQIERVIKFYQNNNCNKSFNKNIAKITEDYQNFLNNLGYKYNKNKAKYYFGFKPLIKKQYPRYTAKINYEATNYFKSNLYSKATKLYLNNYKMTGSTYSLINAIKSLFFENKFALADSIIISEIGNNIEGGNYYNLLFKHAETKILLKDTVNTKYLIKKLKLYNISNKINLDLFKFELLLEESFDLCKSYILSNYNDNIVVDRINNPITKLYFVGNQLNKYQNQLLMIDKDLNNLVLFYYSENALKSGEYNLAKNLINKFKYLNKDNNYICLIKNQINKIDWFANKTNWIGKKKIE